MKMNKVAVCVREAPAPPHPLPSCHSRKTHLQREPGHGMDARNPYLPAPIYRFHPRETLGMNARSPYITAGRGGSDGLSHQAARYLSRALPLNKRRHSLHPNNVGSPPFNSWRDRRITQLATNVERIIPYRRDNKKKKKNSSHVQICLFSF